MMITRREDFLDRLNCREECLDAYGLRELFRVCKRHLLGALDEVGFDDFLGEDCEVMGRVGSILSAHGSESALWGQVFLDMWHCGNFNGRLWTELVKRDPTNIRFAIRVAYWVLVVSGADGDSSLATIINQYDCWDLAQQYIPQQGEDGLRAWWYDSLLPQRITRSSGEANMT